MKIILLLLALALPAKASSLAEARRVAAPEIAGAKQPQIAISNEGILHVAFGSGTSVFATRSLDGGESFGDPVKLGDLPKLALGMRRGPRIAVTEQRVVAAAISHDDGNLYFWTSDDSGRTWSAAKRLNSVPKSAAEGLHALASDGRKRVAAVWLDLRNGKTELWSSVSSDGGQTWPANNLVYRSPDQSICECCHPSAAYTASGDLLVMWRNWLNGNRDMYQAQSSDDGKSFSAAVKIGTGTWKLQACPMDGGSLSVDADGMTFAWRRDTSLYAAKKEGSETVISDVGTQPVVVRTSSGAGFVWQNGANLHWQAPNSKGAIVFAPDGAYASSAWNPKQRNSTVVWESSSGIFARTVR